MLCSPTYICLILLGLPSVLGQSLDRDSRSSQANVPRRKRKSIISNIFEQLQQINDQMESLVSSKKTEQKLVTLKLNEQFKLISEMKKEQSEMKKEQSEMKKEQSEMKKEQAASLAEMKKEQSEMKKEQAASLAGMKEKLTEISKQDRCYKGMPYSSEKYILIEPQVGDLRPYLCDTETDEGGWIVILRRKGESLDFNRTWEDYKKGFGDRNNMWMGNEQMHAITSSGRYELRIEMTAPGKLPAMVTYGNFSVDSEQQKYRLHVGGFNGSGRDNMADHNGMAFSTPDRDNDKWNHNCSWNFGSGWWFKRCRFSCLTCTWKLRWKDYDTDAKPVNYAEMKIRRLPSFLKSI